MTGPKSHGLSIVIPVVGRYDDPQALFRQYKAAVETVTKSYEFVYVLDGENPPVAAALEALQARGERVRVITLNRWFGEATALSVGFEESSAEILLTLPAYEQVDPSEISKVLTAIEGADVVAACRRPRHDPKLNQVQSLIFHRLVKLAAGFVFPDLGCSVRALRREVVDDVAIYGDLHRFLPMLAHRQGFKVIGVDVKQAEKDSALRLYGPGVYVRRLLDIMSSAFLLRFIRKPFRFFGLIGFSVFLLGCIVTAVLVLQRLLLDIPLGDRPALVVSSLIIVLGIQIFAIGLIAEVIIFTQARKLKEYRVERIVAFPPPEGASGSDPASRIESVSEPS